MSINHVTPLLQSFQLHLDKNANSLVVLSGPKPPASCLTSLTLRPKDTSATREVSHFCSSHTPSFALGPVAFAWGSSPLTRLSYLSQLKSYLLGKFSPNHRVLLVSIILPHFMELFVCFPQLVNKLHSNRSHDVLLTTIFPATRTHNQGLKILIGLT